MVETGGLCPKLNTVQASEKRGFIDFFAHSKSCFDQRTDSSPVYKKIHPKMRCDYHPVLLETQDEYTMKHPPASTVILILL